MKKTNKDQKSKFNSRSLGGPAQAALLATITIIISAAGCATSPKPLKPGTARVTRQVESPPTALRAGPARTVEMHELTQPENPAQASSQHVERITRSSLPIPAGSTLVVTTNSGSAAAVAPATLVLAAPTTQTLEVIERTGTTLGAAHRDDSRNLAARFAGLRPVQYTGLLLILGAGALAYFGWWTKAALAAGAGAGMIALAAAIPGHETLILTGGGAVVVLGSLLVLYAYHKGLLDKTSGPNSDPSTGRTTP